MRNFIKKFFGMKYEERMVLTAAVTVFFGFFVAVGKIAIGIFSDYLLCAVGAFNLMLAVAKLICVRGAKKEFGKRNASVAACLFFGGVFYALYMILSLVNPAPPREYSLTVSVSIAAVAFAEMGVSIFGLVRTRRKGHAYRALKIIGFITALTALLTAQIALLAFTGADEAAAYNNYTGIGIACITVLLALFIFFAPRFSTVGRERNRFRLIDGTQNKLVDMERRETEILLHKSRIYGNTVFRAEITGNVVDGLIEKESGVWKRLNVFVKILCIILSEILIFVWAGGYAVHFVRTVNMPGKLKQRMAENGFDWEPL